MPVLAGDIADTHPEIAREMVRLSNSTMWSLRSYMVWWRMAEWSLRASNPKKVRVL